MNGRIIGGTALGVAVFVLLAFASAAVTAQQPSASPAVAAIVSPAPGGSGEPQLTVSERGVLLSWIERSGSTTTLRFAERTSAGWTEPRTVASGNDWTVNAVDVPSVHRLADGTLAAQWLQKSGKGMHANDIRLSYSKDDGRTWAATFSPHGNRASDERGFTSLFAPPLGGLGVIWLEAPPAPSKTAESPARANHAGGEDHAARQQAAGHQGHAGRGGQHGATAARPDVTMRITTFDRTWKQSAEQILDTRTCECCPTAAVATATGAAVVYRNRSDDEIRDIYIARLEEGRWSEGVPVHADNWRIAGCPANGAALSADGRTVAVAWYTVKEDQGRAMAAFSRDGGRTFGAPVRLDDGGSLGRVDIELLRDGAALATWVEVVDKRGQFRARRVTPDGRRSEALTIADITAARNGRNPRVARHGDEVILAWVETVDGTS